MARPKDAQLGAGVGASVSAKKRDSKDPSDAASWTRLLDPLLSLLIPSLVLLHLVVAPYTKVEESFNIQAAHDVLVYGTPTSDIHHKLSTTYDHFTFPGAVPRTFVGPVFLAAFAQPVVALVGFQHAQFVVRAILGLWNAACLHVFARNLGRAYGPGVARWYLLLQASQFHIIFYASRTLPNMFAFGLTTLAFSFLLPNPSNPRSNPRRQRLSITMFVFAAAIFRSEVALLLATTVLYLLVLPELSVERVVFPFAVSFLTALATSVPVDSYFWQRPLWPELWGFYYNVVQGSASNWGVSPWHYYFTSALPRLLVNPLSYTVLIPFALYHPALRRGASRLAIPSLLFTAIYSLQPHKETRFIFYAIPPLTAAAALSANFFFSRRGRSTLSLLFAAVLSLSVLASLAASTAMLALSALNYPGGEALSFLRHHLLTSSQPVGGVGGIVPVHADVPSCMTGVTLFGASTASTPAEAAAFLSTPPAETAPIHANGAAQKISLFLDKTESPASLLASPSFWSQFTYVLTSSPSSIPSNPSSPNEWKAVAVIPSYAGIEFLRPRDPPTTEDDLISRSHGFAPIVGKGRAVVVWKRWVRGVTGGWWIGPRMREGVFVLRRVAEGEEAGGRRRVGAEVM